MIVVTTTARTGADRRRDRTARITSIHSNAPATATADGSVGGSVDPRIIAALLRRPARQRQVVALRLFLDLDTAGTAQVLGIAPGTVQAHLGRAMAALRDDLIPTRQEKGPGTLARLASRSVRPSMAGRTGTLNSSPARLTDGLRG